MSSSDSEDDCYGNIAQKLKQIKSSFLKEKIDNIVSNDNNEVAKTSETLTKNVENASEIIAEDLNTTVNSTDNEEFTLDAIIANNSKALPIGRGRGRGRGRGSKRKASSDTSETSERATGSTRRKTSNSTKGRTSPLVPGPTTAPIEHNIAPVARIPEPVPEITTRGRGRGGTRARGSRGRARGRGRTRRDLWAMFDEMFANTFLNPNPLLTPAPSHSSSNYPTYSIGNTDEYPDQSDNQQLFSTRLATDDVEVIEDEDPLDNDNEEMSVKVYWQSLEIFKFKIRKYQKLTQIFEYFTEKEGVSNDKLLFTYNDRILKIDDTPDSINYSIAKFIDGGIVNQTVTHLAQERSREDENNGLKIKFQCQNKKKPFETMLRPEDKLALAMMKCAEHLETPIERLKFYFDGDLITKFGQFDSASLSKVFHSEGDFVQRARQEVRHDGFVLAMTKRAEHLETPIEKLRVYFDGDLITSKSTPQDLELEGGECIDVKISS